MNEKAIELGLENTIYADPSGLLAANVSSAYETDKLLSEYLEFHYGDDYFGVANFPAALARLAIRAMGSRPARHALDLGCAVGRASFELARHFDAVTGVVRYSYETWKLCPRSAADLD